MNGIEMARLINRHKKKRWKIPIKGADFKMLCGEVNYYFRQQIVSKEVARRLDDTLRLFFEDI